MQINVNAASERILGESDLQKCGCGENPAKMLMIMKKKFDEEKGQRKYSPTKRRAGVCQKPTDPSKIIFLI